MPDEDVVTTDEDKGADPNLVKVSPVRKETKAPSNKLESAVKNNFPRSADLLDILATRGVTLDNVTASHLRRAFAPLIADAIRDTMAQLED